MFIYIYFFIRTVQTTSIYITSTVSLIPFTFTSPSADPDASSLPGYTILSNGSGEVLNPFPTNSRELSHSLLYTSYTFLRDLIYGFYL